MIDQIVTMLEMQDAMNAKVHPKWREQNFAWYRAIWVECAELMDHYGWKWWKKQTPDTEQVILELIDIWHFGLSVRLAEQAETSQLTCVELADSVAKELVVQASDEDFRTLLEAFTETTLRTRGFDVTGFAKLMGAVGLSFDRLYASYVGKNVLNYFRQDHGYKEGTYAKVWEGKEDNEHLVEILASLDTSDANFKETLYQALLARYPANA